MQRSLQLQDHVFGSRVLLIIWLTFDCFTNKCYHWFCLYRVHSVVWCSCQCTCLLYEYSLNIIAGCSDFEFFYRAGLRHVSFRAASFQSVYFSIKVLNESQYWFIQLCCLLCVLLLNVNVSGIYVLGVCSEWLNQCELQTNQAVREAATVCPLWPFDLESGVLVTCDVGYLCANFSLPRPLCSRLMPDVRDRQTSDVVRRQTRIIA